MKLEEIQQTTLTKTIFATLALSALVGTMLIFPSLGYIINQFSKSKKQQEYVKRIFRKLKNQKLISIHEEGDGKITITLTDEGKIKALSFQIDSLSIPKPKNWDGRWRIIIFDIPENKKQARDLFRQHLKRLGFYALQRSVFIHPYPCKDQVDFLKHNFEVAECVTFIQARYLDNQNLLRNHFQV